MLNLFYFSGQAGGVGLLAFGINWYRQKEHLPSTLGFLRLLALFAAVVGISIITFIVLLVGTELAGVSNNSSLQQPYLILSGVSAYLAGSNIITRMLRGKG